MTDEDLAVGKEALLAEWRGAMATVEGAAAWYGFWTGVGVGPDRARELPARVSRLTRDDAVRVAGQYLDEASLHVVFLGDDRGLDLGALGLGQPESLTFPK